VALDYIGKRGSVPGVTKQARIQYAREILQRELLPHIGIGEQTETRKAFFCGYMVHRLLLVSARRRKVVLTLAPGMSEKDALYIVRDVGNVWHTRNA